MTDQKICPRCGALVKFWSTGRIKPHHDPITDEACYAAGKTLAEVEALIAAARWRLGLDSSGSRVVHHP